MVESKDSSTVEDTPPVISVTSSGFRRPTPPKMLPPRKAGPRCATMLDGRRQLVALSPLEMWKKLKIVMGPVAGQKHGMSTNALAAQLDIPLTALNYFLKSGGAPTKFDEQTREYTTEPLRTLAEWLDGQSDAPGRVKGKPRGARQALADPDLDAPSTPPTRPAAVSAAACAASTPRSSSSSSTSSSHRPTELGCFLESLGAPFPVYGGALARLGVWAPAQLCTPPPTLDDDSPAKPARAHLSSGGAPAVTFEQLLDAGVKKLHARRLVAEANRYERGASRSPSRSASAASTASARARARARTRTKAPGAPRRTVTGDAGGAEVTESGDYGLAQMAALLAQAEAMGLAGEDLENAKRAVAATAASSAKRGS